MRTGGSLPQVVGGAKRSRPSRFSAGQVGRACPFGEPRSSVIPDAVTSRRCLACPSFVGGNPPCSPPNTPSPPPGGPGRRLVSSSTQMVCWSLEFWPKLAWRVLRPSHGIHPSRVQPCHGFPVAAVGETRAFDDPGAQCGTWLSVRGVTVPKVSLSELHSSCLSMLLVVSGIRLSD